MSFLQDNPNCVVSQRVVSYFTVFPGGFVASYMFPRGIQHLFLAMDNVLCFFTHHSAISPAERRLCPRRAGNGNPARILVKGERAGLPVDRLRPRAASQERPIDHAV